MKIKKKKEQKNIIIGDCIGIINTYQTTKNNDKNRLLHTYKKMVLWNLYLTFQSLFCKYNKNETSNNHNFKIAAFVIVRILAVKMK